MNRKLMILPSNDPNRIKLIMIPADYDEHEVYRHVTGIIAQVEESQSNYQWEDVLLALEDLGFENLEYILGPTLD